MMKITERVAKQIISSRLTTFYLSLCCKRYFSFPFHPGYRFPPQSSSFDSGHHLSLFYRGVYRGRSIPLGMDEKQVSSSLYTTITLVVKWIEVIHRDEVEGNIRTRGKTKQTNFPRDHILSALLYI